MNINDLFRIIIKVFGLFFFKDIVYWLFTSFLSLSSRDSIGSYNLMPVLIVAFLYAFLIYIFLFRTDTILKYIKLEETFSSSPFDLRFSSKTILNLACVIISGVILLNEFPLFFSGIFTYFEMKNAFNGRQDMSISFFILPLIKSGLALLVIGERKRIVAYLDKQN